MFILIYILLIISYLFIYENFLFRFVAVLLSASSLCAGMPDMPASRAATSAALSRSDLARQFEPQVQREFHQNYNSAIYCPEGSYAYGFSQKTDKGCHGGGACSGLLGVALLCSADKQKQIGTARMELGYGFGDESSDVNWRAGLTCENSYINGVQALSMADQGWFGDDHGVMAVGMMCDNDAKLINSNNDITYKNRWNWSGFTYCGAGEAVCGVASAGSRDLEELFDDWGITKLKFFCCTVKA